ncbi:uncharacterized protein LOC109788738 [Cajanus cajan]|uniref:Transmembrane protein n=1 Tax=Cajanus cajan TaxID=3821 RepID=A0A151RA62_CAJCA|nr:uncharacterized protein LOC109788738 [Cajanus cajan]KYP39396.1 hypothetical protein KK1_039305 [Cajanus cajan]
MLHSHQHLLFSTLPVPLSLTHHHHHHPSPSLIFLHRPITTTTTTVSAIPYDAWLAQLTTTQELLGGGPIELPFSTPSVFTDEPSSSTLQLASTLLLSGAIALFLFRSIRRRVKRAKQLKFRSSGVNKSLDSLNAMRSSSIKAKNPPSPDQALLGAVIAGVIAVFLYRFTTSIESSLGRQTLSDNFSVRQITITIRTIINGLCYLATFVYGINSVGLFLYSGQLAMDTIVGGSTGKESESKIIKQQVQNLTNNKLSNTKEDQGSNNSL